MSAPASADQQTTSLPRPPPRAAITDRHYQRLIALRQRIHEVGTLDPNDPHCELYQLLWTPLHGTPLPRINLSFPVLHQLPNHATWLRQLRAIVGGEALADGGLLASSDDDDDDNDDDGYDDDDGGARRRNAFFELGNEGRSAAVGSDGQPQRRDGGAGDSEEESEAKWARHMQRLRRRFALVPKAAARALAAASRGGGAGVAGPTAFCTSAVGPAFLSTTPSCPTAPASLLSLPLIAGGQSAVAGNKRQVEGDRLHRPTATDAHVDGGDPGHEDGEDATTAPGDDALLTQQVRAFERRVEWIEGRRRSGAVSSLSEAERVASELQRMIKRRAAFSRTRKSARVEER